MKVEKSNLGVDSQITCPISDAHELPEIESTTVSPENISYEAGSTSNTDSTSHSTTPTSSNSKKLFQV